MNAGSREIIRERLRHETSDCFSCFRRSGTDCRAGRGAVAGSNSTSLVLHLSMRSRWVHFGGRTLRIGCIYTPGRVGCTNTSKQTAVIRSLLSGLPTELFMRARVGFSLLSLVALFLFLAAAVPSFATQHRDPVMPAENAQKAPADGASTISTPTTKASAKSRAATPKRSAKKNAAVSANNASAKNHAGSGTGMK